MIGKRCSAAVARRCGHNATLKYFDTFATIGHLRKSGGRAAGLDALEPAGRSKNLNP